MSTVLVFAGIFLCLCLSNFCSASEMAFSSCNVMRLENARDDGSKRAKIAVYITEHFDDALSAILIGNNLANIGASSLASVAVILVTGGDEYAWLATIILTVLVIIFGETMPKISAKKNANRTSLKNAYVVRAMMIIFYPLVWLVVSLIKLLTMGMKPEAADADSDEAVEELQSIIETAEDEDVLDEDQSELVQAAIDFSETSAFEVMTARVDVQAIDIEDDWDDILAIIEDAPFTRLPVYEGSIDNVIDLNFYPLEYARLTNHKYRSIGLGVSGYHHMLAKRGIRWESEEHLAFADAVFERINYAAIRADTALAREKGCYALFEGSDWQTGAYFEKRGYASGKWRELAETVAAQGMRNAYLLAIAPTSSTSILSGTTAGIDPVMRRFFLEEKKGSILPRVAPELSLDTWWYYKAAHLIDQSWSVRAAGVRQRHIDQAQSMNLYITNDYTMRQVLALYLDAWRSGVKTIYYIRSKSLEVEDCESCAS